MKVRAALLILCLPVAAGLSAGAADASAASVDRGARAPAADLPSTAPAAARTTSRTVSMDQAVKMVERRFHARVVKAETQRDNGRTLYVLRLLSDSGRVWTVRVDAADGAVQ